MDELLRRRYLQAMGIPLWLRRGEPPAPPRPEPSGYGAEGAIPTPVAPASDLPPESQALPLLPAPPPGIWSAGAEALDWEALRERVAGCTACAELVHNRTQTDRKSTRLNSSHNPASRMPSSA
jgi:DNA polymerase